jgi:peptide/nickel transport system substrate-binding protein
MKTRKRSILIPLLASAALVLAGCASGGGETEPEDHSPLIIGLNAAYVTLDPTAGAGPELDIFENTFESLTEINPETGELEPKLATSWELTDERTWRFHLREGVTFHDGSPFTAADVVFSTERIMADGYAGAHAAAVRTIESIEAVDDLTVDVTTTAPDPLLPRKYQIAGGAGHIFIVSHTVFENAASDEDAANALVGTGPYMLDELDPGVSVLLKRYDDYWGEAPEIEAADFRFIPENSTRVNSLLTGEIDVAVTIPAADVARIDSSSDAAVVSSDNGLVIYMILNTTAPPLDDPEVREAVVSAIDLEGTLSALLGDKARLLPGIIPDNVPQSGGVDSPHEYDPSVTEGILEDMGPITLNVTTSSGRYPADAEIYEATNQQLTEAGFTVNATSKEWASFLTDIIQGNTGAFYILGADWGERDASKLASMIDSAQPINESDEVKELIAEQTFMTDTDERDDTWREIEGLVQDENLFVGSWQMTADFGVSGRVEWQPASGKVTLRDMTYAG